MTYPHCDMMAWQLLEYTRILALLGIPRSDEDLPKTLLVAILSTSPIFPLSPKQSCLNSHAIHWFSLEKRCCVTTQLTVAEAKTSFNIPLYNRYTLLVHLLLNSNDIRQFCFPGLASWFKRQPASVKAAVVISAILVFSLLITGLVYCCKKRRAPVADVVKVKPPSYDEATTTKTKVPLEPLVNEED